MKTLDVTPGTAERYVPAAGRASFTGIYDRMMALTMREDAWRPRLVAAVLDGLAPGASVVDVGAGTGTLALALASARPDVGVTAVDGDEDVLALARAKPGAASVDWRPGLADALPLEDASADRVVMSLLLHHLGPAAKAAAQAEARRVLRAGGRLHVADWGRPGGLAPRAGFAALRLLDGRANTADHAAGRRPALIAQAGFAGGVVTARLATPWGTLELLRADRGDER